MDKLWVTIFDVTSKISTPLTLAAFAIAVLALIVWLYGRRPPVAIVLFVIAAVMVLALVPALIGSRAIYHVRVTVVDPKDVPVEDATVWLSVGGEPDRRVLDRHVLRIDNGHPHVINGATTDERRHERQHHHGGNDEKNDRHRWPAAIEPHDQGKHRDGERSKRQRGGDLACYVEDGYPQFVHQRVPSLGMAPNNPSE